MKNFGVCSTMIILLYFATANRFVYMFVCFLNQVGFMDVKSIKMQAP